MPATSNGSLYTISIVDAPILKRATIDLLRSNAIAAINYLGEYIRWKGSLDFVIRWDSGSRFSWGDNGFGAYGGIGSDGKTYALSEAITGVDSNGTDFDAGTWISPGNDSIVSYGEEVFIDPSPNPKDEDLAGQTDFLSIFLHEVMHSLGMWSTAQHGESYGQTSFDALTFLSNNRWYFSGSKVNEIYGGPLPLAVTGSRDHYSHDLPLQHDLVREFGFREKWQISDIDLAILHDLGVDVIKWSSIENSWVNGRFFYTNGVDALVGQSQINIGMLDGNDVLEVVGGVNNFANGNIGDDRITIKGGLGRYLGGSQNDVLSVEAAEAGSWVNGNKDNDVITGNVDGVVYRGGSENDTLIVGAGTVWGDKGADTFRAVAGSGVAVVQDYTPGLDFVEGVSGGSFSAADGGISYGVGGDEMLLLLGISDSSQVSLI